MREERCEKAENEIMKVRDEVEDGEFFFFPFFPLFARVRWMRDTNLREEGLYDDVCVCWRKRVEREAEV